MTALKDQTLSGQVPAYNGVQFGGSDSDFNFTPPQYDLAVVPVYDDANREVVHLEYTLSVNCWIYHNSEPNLSLDQDTIRRLLSEPGRPILLGNLGMGFVSSEPDIIWGPKPVFLQIKPVGTIATEVNWVCKFNGAPCEIVSGTDSFFKAFNYTTTWGIDHEGSTVRTISGYIEMAQTRSLTSPRQVNQVVDQLRDNIDVQVPPCFRRDSKTFTESADKTRLDFTITDIEVTRDVLPQGMTMGHGTFGFTTGEMPGGTVTQIEPSLNVTLYTADGVPYQQGLQKALEIAKAKGDAMQATVNGKGTVLVTSISIDRGLFYDANRTTLSVSWLVIGHDFNQLQASALYEQLPDSVYTDWRNSINHTWANRGNRKLRSRAEDDDILSICDQVGGVTLSADGQCGDEEEDYPDYTLVSCPPVDQEQSYIKYDVSVGYRRQDDQQAYKPAALYEPEEESEDSYLTAEGLSHPHTYDTDEYTEEVTEQYGYPQQVVRLKFFIARVHFIPDAPKLLQLNGQPVEAEMIDEWTEAKTVVQYGCPIHTLIGWRDYRIKSHVPQQQFNYGTPLVPGGNSFTGYL